MTRRSTYAAWILPLLALVVGALFLAGTGIAVARARSTHQTAFDRWLGPAGMAALGPDATLRFQTVGITHVLDDNVRRTLQADATNAASLGATLRRLGPPPAHADHVNALIGDLYSYATAAAVLGECQHTCDAIIYVLDQQLAKLTASSSLVHADAKLTRGAPLLKSR